MDGGATDGGQPFDAGYPTTGKTTLCSTDLKRERWAWMLTQPVKPPRVYAGIDLAGSNQWEGLTIEKAESAPTAADDPTGGLCQSTAFGFEGTCPSGSGGCNGNAWGNNSEVSFSWNVATHLIDQMVLGLGYTGTMQLDPYPDHNGEVHSYTIAIGDVIRRGNGTGDTGESFLVDWSDKDKRSQEITDMFNAAMATFAPTAGLAFDTSTCNADSDCKAPGTVSTCQCAHDPANPGKCTAAGKCGVKNCGNDGNCLVYADGSTTIFGFRPLVVYVEGNDGLPQPAESTPIAIYNFFSKSEPFSNLPQEVKLDAEGPVAQGTPLGLPAGSKITCKQAIGQTFDDFRANCVQVHGDATDPNGVDAVNLNKVIYGLTHDQEHWTANVLGVNQNFTSGKTIKDPDYVVQDSDTPSSGDVAEDWTFDNRARGDTANDDYAAGSSLVGIEWARLMLADIARVRNANRPAGAPPIPTTTLGDPRCVGFDGNGQPNYKSNIDPVTKQSICSGVEGLIIPGGNSGVADTNGRTDFSEDPGAADFLKTHVANLNPVANIDTNGNFYSSLLKPGDVTGAVCIDPGAFTDCTLDSVSVWQNLLKHVTRVLGAGDVNKLPVEMRDRRFYYRTFGQAFVKYLKAYGKGDPATRNLYPGAGGGISPSDVATTDIDLESFFFDYNATPGSGSEQTYDKFEYVERDFIGQGVNPGNTVPWDFEYGVDLFGGNQRYDNWYRRMDREEVALYASLLQDETHTPGQENTVNITNIFGSSVLSSVWPSYNCAIGNYTDPASKDGPTDPDGNSCGSHPMLDPNTTMPKCGSGGACAAGATCISTSTFENGGISVCAAACDYTAHTDTGCPAGQACIADGNGGNGCVDMLMDRNARTSKYSHPIMYLYPGAWTPSLFSKGHSPVHFDASDKRPGAGVVKIHVPDFEAGNYLVAQLPAPTTGDCPQGYTKDQSGAFCNANTKANNPEISALVPWQEKQPGIGFAIPIDGSHSQWVSTGQLDFTGVLETYIIDYVPNYDTGKASCVADGQCNPGFQCDKNSDTCIGTDNSIRVQAVEGDDFIGEAFLCSDPATGDILHVHQYDSMLGILDWLARHPGTSESPSAQSACQIVVSRSENDLYVNAITSKSAGVVIIDGGGQGQGRATDIVLFDTSLIQGL